eukprot:Selendium_serpulae@DN6124_c0_g1_i1.p3
MIGLTTYSSSNRRKLLIFNWHDMHVWSFVQYAGFIKAVVTLVKYWPQVILNYRRKTCKGLSIMQWNLDLMGGIFSICQNASEAWNYQDIGFLTGNIPKMVISCLTVFYDTIICIQYYCIYGGVVDEVKYEKVTDEISFASHRSRDSPQVPYVVEVDASGPRASATSGAIELTYGEGRHPHTGEELDGFRRHSSERRHSSHSQNAMNSLSDGLHHTHHDVFGQQTH